MNQGQSKRLFFIASTDKKQSLTRYYSEAVMEILNSSKQFDSYKVETHVQTFNENLHESLKSALIDGFYEGYVVLLDSIDDNKPVWNPNVMYEFGAISALGKPFVVLDSGVHETKEYPFDISGYNVAHIPTELASFVKECFSSKRKPNIKDWFVQNTSIHNKFDEFMDSVYQRYRLSFEKHTRKTAADKSIHDKLDQIITSVDFLTQNAGEATAKYIDGEAEAFTALYEAIKESKTSLRTTRFANESIVRKPTAEQKMFMNELYSASKRLNDHFVRIICNNDPSKWQDIFQILMNGGNNSRVYVRKEDFSIHFELVIIDDDVTFIHFYQADNSSKKEGNGRIVERLNSTLKIQGRSISKKFSKIYDRLHHRDFEESCPFDPSRTLLGIPLDMQSPEKYKGIGYFEIDDDIPSATRSFVIMRQFKKAFKEWEMDQNDRKNMAVGISLIEMSDDFIKTNEDVFLPEVYQAALDLYSNSIIDSSSN